MMNSKIRIVHVIYQFASGGLENGLVNLMNTLPEDEYDHIILSLTHSSDFAKRIQSKNVRVMNLRKKPGPLMRYFLDIYQILKQLNPDILHTRNFSTLECQFMGALAGIPYRIHSEHGRDAHDIEGKNKKSQWIRKSMKPFVHQYIALSQDLAQYLRQCIQIADQKLVQIYNGVNTHQFQPGMIKPYTVLSAGRLDEVKDFATLIRAFAIVRQHFPQASLKIAGEGPARAHLAHQIQALNQSEHIQLLGHRDDLNDLMAEADIYVQTSIFEGISNTLLEAMSSACCVIATQVGGNPELIQHQSHGVLIPPKDVNQLAQVMTALFSDDHTREVLRHQARKHVIERFSLEAMTQRYAQIYQAKRGVLCAA